MYTVSLSQPISVATSALVLPRPAPRSLLGRDDSDDECWSPSIAPPLAQLRGDHHSLSVGLCGKMLQQPPLSLAPTGLPGDLAAVRADYLAAHQMLVRLPCQVLAVGCNTEGMTTAAVTGRPLHAWRQGTCQPVSVAARHSSSVVRAKGSCRRGAAVSCR